jgi:hypothetical protein
MKKLLVLPIILLLSLFLALPVSAADFYVECGNGCKKTGFEPLFPDSEIWYPGKTLTKTFSLKNISSSVKEMAIGITSSWGDRELEKVMTVEIVKNSGGEVVWSKDTLEKFYSQGKISMGSFNPGDEVEFAIKVAMLPEADNEYQNKKSYFDLKLGFWEEPVSPTPTPTTVLVHGARTARVVEWYDGQGGPLEDNLGGGIATTTGEVAGTKAPICPFWWIVLAGQTLLLAVFYFLARKVKGLVGFKWPVTWAIVALGFFLDRYAHTHWYLPSRVCPYEVWLGGALAILEWRILPFPKTKKSRKLRFS